jgi:hypothetical protein
MDPGPGSVALKLRQIPLVWAESGFMIRAIGIRTVVVIDTHAVTYSTFTRDDPTSLDGGIEIIDIAMAKRSTLRPEWRCQTLRRCPWSLEHHRRIRGSSAAMAECEGATYERRGAPTE